MARLIGNLNEGSLLRRTLIHVGTFALGSMAFIALASFLLVTAARAILPSHAEDGEESKEAAAEEEATPDKKTTTARSPRPSRRKVTEPAAAAPRDSE